MCLPIMLVSGEGRGERAHCNACLFLVCGGCCIHEAEDLCPKQREWNLSPAKDLLLECVEEPNQRFFCSTL